MEHLMQLAAVCGTLGMLAFTLSAFKRARGEAKTTARISVQQRIPLGNNCQLIVVHWDGRELLLTTGTQPCSLVASKPIAPPQSEAEVQSIWAL